MKTNVKMSAEVKCVSLQLICYAKGKYLIKANWMENGQVRVSMLKSKITGIKNGRTEFEKTVKEVEAWVI